MYEYRFIRGMQSALDQFTKIETDNKIWNRMVQKQFEDISINLTSYDTAYAKTQWAKTVNIKNNGLLDIKKAVETVAQVYLEQVPIYM